VAAPDIHRPSLSRKSFCDAMATMQVLLRPGGGAERGGRAQAAPGSSDVKKPTTSACSSRASPRAGGACGCGPAAPAVGPAAAPAAGAAAPAAAACAARWPAAGPPAAPPGGPAGTWPWGAPGGGGGAARSGGGGCMCSAGSSAAARRSSRRSGARPVRYSVRPTAATSAKRPGGQCCRPRQSGGQIAAFRAPQRVSMFHMAASQGNGAMLSQCGPASTGKIKMHGSLLRRPA